VTTAAQPAAPTVRRRGALREVLRGADFRRLYATRLSSQCADGVFQASLAGAVLFNPERTTDATQIAASFTVLLLPYSLVGPFAGVLLDRWRRQRVLVAANLVRCVGVALVAGVIALGVSGPAFYASALAVLSVNRLFLAALSASLPHVVPAGQLVTANALATTSGTVAASLGGGLALLIRGAVGSGDAGYAVVALCSTVGYALAALLALGFSADKLGPDDVERSGRETARDVLRGLIAGARHVMELRPAAYALAAISAHRFCFGISFITTLLLYRNYFTTDGFFRAGLAGLGQVVAATGVGVLAAAVVTPPVVRRIGKPAWITVTLLLAAVAEVALGVPFTMQTLLPAAVILAFVAQAAKISVDTIVQETVEDEYRGRVFSFYDTLFNVTFVAAALVAAFVLPDTGKSYAVVAFIAAGYALTALGYWVGVKAAPRR
jgi:MFS family permease